MTISDSDAALELELTKPRKSSSIPITAIAFAVIVMYLTCMFLVIIKAFRPFAVVKSFLTRALRIFQNIGNYFSNCY